MRAALMLLVLALALPARAQDTDGPGGAVYRGHCASCHDGAVARAPGRDALKQMSADHIRAALESGIMKAQGATLTAAERQAVSRYLGSAATATAPPAQGLCPAGGGWPADPATAPRWNGWGGDLAQRRFQPAAMAQITVADVPRLKLVWAFGFPGVSRAFAQPAVIGGWLFVGSAAGKVYALDARTGCTHWSFDAAAPVRTAISAGQDAHGWSIYFGDLRANAYALDALTGTLLWKTHVAEHPAALITGAPSLAQGVLYVPLSSAEEVTGADPRDPCCTFRGGVTALDAASGKVLWHAYTIPQAPHPVRKNAIGTQLWGPSGAGIWSSPTVDLAKRLIYVTTGDSYSDPPADTSDAFVAFDLNTGALRWSKQMTTGDSYNVSCNGPAPANCPEARGPDFDFGSSAILVNLGGGQRALIAGQKSGMVHAIDPDRNGAVLWQRRVGHGSALGGVQWGSAADDEKVYVALSDVVPRPAAPDTPGAQEGLFRRQAFCLDSTQGGGLFALDLKSGAVVWHTPHPGCGDVPGCSPAQSAAVTAIPGVVFSGGLDGHLRAYAADDGRILWDIDTKREYATVNGVPAHGGSLDGPGAVIVGGMLYVNSGYAFFGSAPGNVLLAFSLGDKEASPAR